MQLLYLYILGYVELHRLPSFVDLGSLKACTLSVHRPRAYSTLAVSNQPFDAGVEVLMNCVCIAVHCIEDLRYEHF